MYLIQGVFFQNYSGLGVSMGSEVDGGTRLVIRTSVAQFFVFHGVIGRDPYCAHCISPNIVGEIHDQLGKSKLINVQITDTEFSFTKDYERRDYSIDYRFKKQPNGIWEGEYEGPPTVGTGFTRCILVEVPDDFLVAPPEVFERAKREYEATRAREADDLYAVHKIPKDPDEV